MTLISPSRRNGDGITKKVGCDGEVARALPTDRTHKVKCVLLQTSDSNSVFQAAYKRDLETGEGKGSSPYQGPEGRSAV